jgi:hypothetical protein
VNTYADACKALREAIEDYIDAAAWELRHKMPPLDAIDLANATAQKAVGVIAHEASQRLASHIQVPDDLAAIFEKNGGVLVPRIRTIKPEFWDSPDVADASAVARLLFIAMWNWADDAGRGSANLKELEGFAFPNDDVTELSGGKCRSFRHALAEVRDCFGVLFYKVRGRPFYEIPSWRKHQRNERVAKGKFPPSSEGETWDFMSPDQGRGGTSDTLRRDAAEDHDNSSEEFGSSGTGTGEQGNRGTANTSRPAEPSEVFDGFELDEPLIDPTYEIGSDDDPKFCEFWAAVPKKDGKTEARAAWSNHVQGKGTYKGQKITKTDPDVIIAGMLAYAERVRRDGTERKHIKMAEGWLNGRRWEDEQRQQQEQRSMQGAGSSIWD